jgi:hypothetical protein
MSLEVIGAAARIGASGPGAMKSLPKRIGRRNIGELLDVAGTNGQLGGLVNDQAVDFAPPDGMGCTIGIPCFQQVVRDIAECAQCTAYWGERGVVSSEAWLADEDDEANEGVAGDDGCPGDTLIGIAMAGAVEKYNPRGRRCRESNSVGSIYWTGVFCGGDAPWIVFRTVDQP